MECHADTTLTMTRDGQDVSMHVDMDILDNSIHAGWDCVDCHNSIDALPHDPDLPRADCSMCHDTAYEEYSESIHARALEEGIMTAALCQDCHGNHNILSADEVGSQVNQRHLSETCGKCHSRPDVIQIFSRRGFDPVKNFEQSVHGKKLKEDPDSHVATCVACHGSHEIYPPLDPRSSFSKFKVPETCGQCHEEATSEYKESVHWRAVEWGHYQSPVCNDCHGEHNIYSPSEIESQITDPALVSSQLCENCHSNDVLMKRFGLDAERFDSYMKTYHGLAVLKGSPEAASCVSCHETHAIRTASDPASSVHLTNLEETCGKCHERVTPSFIQIEMHPRDQQARNPIAYYVRIVYYWLIGLTIGGMLLHNAVIFFYYLVEKWRSDKKQTRIRRFQPLDVVNHFLLAVSFTALVITGFALKFPDAMWVQFLLDLGMTEAVRSWVHRAAAIVLVVISLVQVAYFIVSHKGRRDAWALRPTIDDITGFIKNMRYYLRLSKEHPKFGRYDYTEKAEYLALVWGTAVMAASGFVLWFPGIFMSFLPGWFFEVAEMVHYYEAWLATLAIIVWHGFFVMYHPEKYPMSMTWIDGKITEEEFEHHHPLEKEELERTGQTL